MLETQTAQELGKAIDQKIETAFDQGYKAATLHLAPQLEYWKTQAEEKQRGFLKGLILGASLTTVIAAAAVIIFQTKGGW